MKWVLVFIFMSESFGSFTVTANFDSEAACRAAESEIIAYQDNVFRLNPHTNYIFSRCLPASAD